MSFKLPLRNVRRSLRDYSIYFLTLTFGVCIFYIFNSLQAQQAVLSLNDVQHKLLQATTAILDGLSVFVSVILGFLILYANRFLIRRRKKELGLYLTLGMDKGRVSRILIAETFFIGIIALGVGLLLGVFASQGLAVLTAQLFEVQMKEFQFIFSSAAFFKTMLYFGIIFVLVMIFNTLSISRYKLIDLLYAGKKNEAPRVKSLTLSVVLFLLSVACLGTAYALIFKNRFLTIDATFVACLAFGVVGTFLFFLSLSGFLLKLIKTSKRFYLRGLNMFVLRQLNSKINTHHISMTLICLMLLVTVGTLSTGMGVVNVMTGDLHSANPYDVTIYSSMSRQEDGSSYVAAAPLEVLAQKGVQLEAFAGDTEQVTFYSISEPTFDKILARSTHPDARDADREALSGRTPDCISLSSYNGVRRLLGKEPVTLAQDAYLMICDVQDAVPVFQSFLDTGGEIEILGKKLHPENTVIQQDALQNASMRMTLCTLVLPDELAQPLTEARYSLLVNYPERTDAYEAVCREQMKNTPGINFITRQEMFAQSTGFKTMVSYVVIYLGVVFLITAAAVLALQQLSEAADNVERYTLLRKLGADDKMLSRALFAQVGTYFLVPLALALVHAYVGLSVVVDVLQTLGRVDVFGSIMFAAALLVVIYGGYFLLTYLGSKAMIRPKKS